MAVSKRLRYEIFRRDNHTCRYCGASAPLVPLRVDHVTPVALGGTDKADNLVTACEPCNSGKSSASPDAALVADVSGDALRWAAAMKQAADDLRDKQAPKVAYRESFEKSWRGWTREDGWKTARVELPDSWKTSLDTFYEAGLPQEVWPDIIEKAMTNPTVRVDNTFRYACGIAWRVIKELHERAREIVAPQTNKAAPALSSVGQAALDLWAHNWKSDLEVAPSDEEHATFVRSLMQIEASTDWVDPKPLIAAAAFGGSAGLSTIEEAMAGATDQERADVVINWCDAWTDLDGAATYTAPPDSFLFRVVQTQVDDLADGDVALSRIRRAAVLAGFHHSSELHHGLRANEVEHTGVDAFRQRAADLWSRSFRAAANRWPEPDERGAFLSHYNRVAADGDFYLNDVLAAAVAAGAYQDTDLTTCLPRHLSVLEIAAQPLGGAA
ncbi:HNH endonuclease [Streptomyces acidicola]|uniref:HNH endonuclease n=1 Tax=Streptomyces acidicola TaxID=2596892 RepID=A0A5N8WI07_9ACTN|nr:HNH endonuclease [Streptomyces acidicola]MPY47083.1 HNH endonuclease [Streptomyces acidicola]MPY47222.1 HNH endonuclease [Streptomyces acidicola]